MEHECLQGSDLRVLLETLDKEAADGWELVCSSVTHSWGAGGGTKHFLFIRRKKPKQSRVQ